MPLQKRENRPGFIGFRKPGPIGCKGSLATVVFLLLAAAGDARQAHRTKPLFLLKTLYEADHHEESTQGLLAAFKRVGYLGDKAGVGSVVKIAEPLVRQRLVSKAGEKRATFYVLTYRGRERIEHLRSQPHRNKALTGDAA